MQRSRVYLVPVLMAALAGCSPALNWRETPLDAAGAVALLPCKPDHGSRPQSLAGHELTLNMQGCETAGALFVLASTELPQPARALPVQVQWQANLLGNMQAQQSANMPYAIAGAAGPLEPVLLQAQGKRPDGTAVQVQAVWFAKEKRLYHAAIYAEKIRPEMTEMFMGGLKLK